MHTCVHTHRQQIMKVAKGLCLSQGKLLFIANFSSLGVSCFHCMLHRPQQLLQSCSLTTHTHWPTNGPLVLTYGDFNMINIRVLVANRRNVVA